MSILFERRHEPLLPLRIFWRRWAVFVASATGLVLFSLLAGMVGYCYFEKMGAVDAFENAAMILSGIRPADALHTEAGKLFPAFSPSIPAWSLSPPPACWSSRWLTGCCIIFIWSPDAIHHECDRSVQPVRLTVLISP